MQKHKFGGFIFELLLVFCLVQLFYPKKKSEKVKIELSLFLYSMQMSSQDYVCYPHIILSKNEFGI